MGAPGVLLVEIARGSPAYQAGLRAGDILVRIRDYQLKGMKDLVGALSKLLIGDEVSVYFVRAGATYETTLRLAEAPKPIAIRQRDN